MGEPLTVARSITFTGRSNMFTTSKIIRGAFWACLAMAWLPIGDGVLQPAGAKADEFVRVVRRPVVTLAPAAPVVRVAPVVRLGPVYVRPWYRGWYGYRWYR
jgi:hypothetical protein